MTLSISHYMTSTPCTIDRDDSIANAHAIMRGQHIRHLPVVHDGQLVGIVTQGDLHLLETLGDIDLDTTPVSEAMRENPFIVTGDTALDDVVEIMADKKYGSAIVVGRAGVEGIFTAVDACRVLAQTLRREVA